MSGWEPLIEFANDSRDFALGFELGRAWAFLYGNDEAFDCELHADNAEMILRLAESSGRSVRTVEHDDVWVTAYFSERSEGGVPGGR